MSVDGATNSPTGDADGPDGEVELDIEVSGAVAPSAQIAVYFTPNTDQGFLDALTTAGKVQPYGRGRARRWIARPVPGFATTLLLPGPLPRG